MARRFTLALCLLALASSACTSIGYHSAAVREHTDFGERQTVSLCLYVDQGISEQRARALVDAAWKDEGRLYGLDITVAKVIPWKRPAFALDGILTAVTREPLQAPCDRVMALIGRHAGDVLWGLLGMPEVLGAVNDDTFTHGYTVARMATVNQIGNSPASILRHELYHMLGCDEHFNMTRCYEQIARLKRWRAEQRSDFYPGWDAINRRIVPTREEVNARLLGAEAASALPRESAAPRRIGPTD